MRFIHADKAGKLYHLETLTLSRCPDYFSSFYSKMENLDLMAFK